MPKPIFCWLLGCVLAAAQSSHPQRKVQGNVLASDHDPKVNIQLPGNAHYLGADRWVLYDLADCELHAFVEADEQKNVKRLYWIQFEAYVPSRPELKHEYDSVEHTHIGGMDFYVDSWARNKNEKTRAGSDRQHITALIEGQGYHMPDGMADLRLVHLLDPSKRRELMIIYGEDIASTGLTVEEVKPGGTAHDRWPGVVEALLRSARKNITIEAGKP